MTRKGRAGKKHQLRKLAKALYGTAITVTTDLIGVDHTPDPEYEAYFAKPIPISSTPRNTADAGDALLYNIQAVDSIYPPPLPPQRDAAPRDPRVIFYNHLRAEYLHYYYGAATPPGIGKNITVATPGAEIQFLKARARQAVLKEVGYSATNTETVTLD